VSPAPKAGFASEPLQGKRCYLRRESVEGINGTWWVHYTLHWDHRKRRIRRSLKTGEAIEAIGRRDALFARIAVEGEEIPERSPPCVPRDDEGRASFAAVA